MSLGHLTGSFMSGLLLSQFIFNVSLYNVWVEQRLSCWNDSNILYEMKKKWTPNNPKKSRIYSIPFCSHY